jgi:hypothetical protein
VGVAAVQRAQDDECCAGGEELRHAVVHELVHAHLRDLYETVQGTAREEFSGVAYRVYEGAVRRDIERAVDALAAVVAEGMPLPSDPAG